MTLSVLSFTLRLLLALTLGSLVGLERQWRQRMAGTRTNALVAAGACAFVMAGYLLDTDPAARGRIVSYVVSGVGFLGAGVIFKDGTNVRGLNTAATIWCSAAMGVLSGLGAVKLALVLATVILLTNVLLRPLAYRLHPVLPEADPIETVYEITVILDAPAEAHLRTLLLTSIANGPAGLQAVYSEDIEGAERVRLRAELNTPGRKNEIVERIVMRLSMEESVSAVNWSVVKTSME